MLADIHNLLQKYSYCDECLSHLIECELGVVSPQLFHQHKELAWEVSLIFLTGGWNF